MEKKIQYRIKHIGLNTENNEEAQVLAKTLCGIFGMEVTAELEANLFVDEIFEVMKHSNIGVRGHIALQTEDVEAAMADLAGKGIHFKEETIRKNDEGKVIFAYLQEEFAGFAFHLTV